MTDLVKLREVLARVASGTDRFAPEGDSLDALREFQSTVRCLSFAKDQNLVAGVSIQAPRKGRDSYGLVALVLVGGGLTLEGQELLAYKPPSAAVRLIGSFKRNVGGFAVTILAGVIVLLIGKACSLQ